MRYFLLPLVVLLSACQFDYNVDGKYEKTPNEDTPTETVEETDTDNDTDIDTIPCETYTWYLDYDQDGYGNVANPMDACEQPSGYVADHTDCDDWHAEQNPAAPEVCNGADDNCDGTVPADEIDADGDGYIGCTASPDCDETNPNVHWGAEEVCDWVQDNNCDGALDVNEIDGAYDSNGDGDYDDAGDAYETSGPDGYTWCFPYHTQNDVDGDGYCGAGLDNNRDGDCMDGGDLIFGRDISAPDYHDCEVTDPAIYPGSGC